MKNFILNLLNILAWLLEILCGLVSVLLVVSLIVMTFNLDSMAKALGIVENVGGNMLVNYIAVFLVIVMFVMLGWTINSIRLVVKNIKAEIYFDQANLKLLHTTLISVGVFTVVSFIESVITGIASGIGNMNGKIVFNVRFNFSDVVLSLIVLGIIYVIYLVFKNGLRLQEESNKII